MHKVVNVDNIDFHEVAWGLTKNIIGPESAGSEKIKINITEYLPGFTHKLHVHPTQEEVIYVLSGKGVSETEAGKIEIGPGSVAFVPAGTAHATQNLSPTESMTAIIIKSPPGDEEVKL
jgi:quercetin dioxygenase-like cupin family protein